jgi:hypothetical protein
MDGSLVTRSPAGQSLTTGEPLFHLISGRSTVLVQNTGIVLENKTNACLGCKGCRQSVRILNIVCSGDLGDFASFVTHMKQIAIVSCSYIVLSLSPPNTIYEQEKDVDLLLVDSGDLHDGKHFRVPSFRTHPCPYQVLVSRMAILLVVSTPTR